MTTSPLGSEAPLFRLSRIGATSHLGELRLEADLSRPSGPGLRLTTLSDGIELHLWISESAWINWLDPQLAIPSLEQIEESLYPLLASWTLAPLDEWLQAQGLPPLAPATLCRAEAPALCWRLTLGSEGRRLPPVPGIGPAGTAPPLARRPQPQPGVHSRSWFAIRLVPVVRGGAHRPSSGRSPPPVRHG